MENWRTYLHTDLLVALRYPNPTPLGSLVLVNEYKTFSSFRVHFASEDSNEIYFEVGQYNGLPVIKAMDDFLKDVTGRIANLKISLVGELTYANAPAHHLSLRWPGKEREILFFEKDGVLYRIIHDPISYLNKKILASLEFLNEK